MMYLRLVLWITIVLAISVLLMDVGVFVLRRSTCVLIRAVRSDCSEREERVRGVWLLLRREWWLLMLE